MSQFKLNVTSEYRKTTEIVGEYGVITAVACALEC